jgi:hypothetical protein
VTEVTQLYCVHSRPQPQIYTLIYFTLFALFCSLFSCLVTRLTLLYVKFLRHSRKLCVLVNALCKYCNVLGYWRRRSVCYSGLFMTSLVVTTISFTMCSYHLSGPGSSALVLWSPWIWSSLVCVGLSLDLLLLSACWSALCDLSAFILLPLK